MPKAKKLTEQEFKTYMDIALRAAGVYFHENTLQKVLGCAGIVHTMGGAAGIKEIVMLRVEVDKLYPEVSRRRMLNHYLTVWIKLRHRVETELFMNVTDVRLQAIRAYVITRIQNILDEMQIIENFTA